MRKTKLQAVVRGAALCAAFAVVSCGTAGGGGPKAKAPAPIQGLVWDWGTFNDADNGGSSKVEMAVSEEGGAPAYSISGEITDQYEYGFVGWYAEPPQDSDAEAAGLAALQGAAAFSFKVLGDGQRYAFKLLTSDIGDYCYYETVFDTEDGVPVTVNVPIAMFVQPSWGRPEPFSQGKAFKLEWQTTNNGRPGAFALKVWDLQVYK